MFPETAGAAAGAPPGGNPAGMAARHGGPRASAAAATAGPGHIYVQLPQHSLGFVYLPALAGIVSASMLTAPLGAKLAHSLPVSRLKKVFALLLLVMGTKMLVSLF